MITLFFNQHVYLPTLIAYSDRSLTANGWIFLHLQKTILTRLHKFKKK